MRTILILGLPLIGGHLAQAAIGMTDTVMMGRYGIEALAAMTLAVGYFYVFFLFGSGFAWAVMPLVAAADGVNDQTNVRRATRMGLWLSLIYAVCAMPPMLFAEPLLILLRQEPDVAAAAARYLRVAGWGIFPALIVMSIKSYLAALERTQIVLWITLLAAVSNGIANWMLIFGNWGAPELGLIGAAIASLVSQAVSAGAVVLYAVRVLPEHSLFARFWRADWDMFKRVGQLGLPIGLTTLSEVSLFTASTIMMGWLGKLPLAAHGIVLSIVSVPFMIYVGLSNVATIRAGQAYGRVDRQDLVTGARAVIMLALMLAVVVVLVFVAIPEILITAFLDADDVRRVDIVAVSVGLLAIGGLFQLADGTQVIALGLLRGVQDTAVPMVVAALAYWGVGIPAAYILGFWVDLGGHGVWLGLVIGLTMASVLLMIRFWTHGVARVSGAMRTT